MGGASGGQLETRGWTAFPSASISQSTHGGAPPAMGGDLTAPCRVVSDPAQPQPREALVKAAFTRSAGAAVARRWFLQPSRRLADAQKQHL